MTKIEMRMIVREMTQDSGLAYVPDLVRAGLSADGLLELFRDGALALRPEGGSGRLSAEDASLCPVDAGGCRLSWARLTKG